MNENLPPLPPPMGATCPNCGAAQTADARICARCGAPMQSAKPSLGRKVLKWVLTTLLSLTAVGFGAFGACAGVIAMIGNSDPSGAYGSGATNAQFFMWGVVVVGAIALCGWLIGVINKNL